MIEFREVKSGDLVNYLDVKSEEEAQVKADSIFLASADHLLKWRILEVRGHCFTQHCMSWAQNSVLHIVGTSMNRKVSLFLIVDCYVSSKEPLEYVIPVYFGVTAVLFSSFLEQMMSCTTDKMNLFCSWIVLERHFGLIPCQLKVLIHFYPILSFKLRI